MSDSVFDTVPSPFDAPAESEVPLPAEAVAPPVFPNVMASVGEPATTVSEGSEAFATGLGSTPSPHIFGIDLGTSNSAIAVSLPGTVLGSSSEFLQTQVLPVDGRETMPSVVYFKPDGSVVVGEEARRQRKVYPDRVVSSIKREIGQTTTHDFDGVTYTPTDISQLILQHLVKSVEKATTAPMGGVCRDVVLCIPANFTDDKKAATRKAAEQAGLTVRYLLEEPVAASIAYSLDNPRSQTILVYDLGGGTFDVSILRAASKSGGNDATALSTDLQLLGRSGIPDLGGDDFDRSLLELAARQFKETTEIDIFDLDKDQADGVSKRILRNAQQRLLDAVEGAKHELSDAREATINVASLVVDGKGNGHDLELTVTRAQFEDAIRPFISKTEDAIRDALRDAKLDMDDISAVVLVGGSTRVPLVREMLTTMLGKPPYSDIDPDTAVARGAAMLGYTLSHPQVLSGGAGNPLSTDGDTLPIPIKISLHTTVTHALGIETRGGKFQQILAKSTPIPEIGVLQRSETFTNPDDNMTQLTIRVYQADHAPDLVSEEGVVEIGEFTLTGLPAAAPKHTLDLVVEFAIDQQNVLRVSGQVAGISQTVEINRTG